MNKDIIELNDGALSNVSGGDWYDLKAWTNPDNVKFLFKVGDTVETRNWIFFTKRARIAEIAIARAFQYGQYIYADIYRVVPPNEPNAEGEWINRNDIEIPGT